MTKRNLNPRYDNVETFVGFTCLFTLLVFVGATACGCLSAIALAFL